MLVQAAVSPKSNQLICLTNSLALVLEKPVGFSTFGVDVASSTSSAIKLGSLASPRARRVRRFPGFSAASVSAFSSVAGADSVSLLAGFTVSSATTGAASAWYVTSSTTTSVVVEASAFPTSVVAVTPSACFSSVTSSAPTPVAVPSMTKVPSKTEQTPTCNLRIENRLIRSLNKSFFTILPPIPIWDCIYCYILCVFLLLFLIQTTPYFTTSLDKFKAFCFTF